MEASQKIQLKSFIPILVSIIVIEWLEKVIVSRTLFDPMIILGAARLLQIILILLLVKIWGKGLEAIGLDMPRIFYGIKKGLLWSFGFGVLAFSGFLVLFIAGIDPLPMIKMPMGPGIKEFILLICIGGILAPVAEEVFFRGVLYGFFRRWGVVVALIVSTLLFVVVHPLGQGIPFIQIVGGILFAVAYEVEGTLMTPITIHILGNCSLFTLSFIS